MIEKFRELVRNRHDYAREWKERVGGKVLGYLCCYVPEEVVYAAGALPVRIMSAEDEGAPVLSQRYNVHWICPFAQGCLEQGLKGNYDYLDGIVMPMTCFHIYNVFSYWTQVIPIPYARRIAVPKAMERKGAKDYYREELSDFKHSLEELTGRTVTNQDLDEAIEICNRNRSQMRSVYELRKNDPPPLSGSEALEMVLSSQLTDKRDHTQILMEQIKTLQAPQGRREGGPRVMILGSVIDNPRVLELIEAQGCHIVTDDLCVGTRYFWDDTLPHGDPLFAIAARYVDRVNCPSKTAGDRRERHILKMARDYDVQGIIVAHQKFCYPHGTVYPTLLELFRSNGFPNTLIELDRTISEGQLQTRIQAFLEMIEIDI